MKKFFIIFTAAYCLEADKSSIAFLNFEPAGDMPCIQYLIWEELNK